jgi:hypothetical protein
MAASVPANTPATALTLAVASACHHQMQHNAIKIF